MIHDAEVEVTCDGKMCSESVLINPEYKYSDFSGNYGYYDTSTKEIEKKLVHEGWFVDKKGQFCSKECLASRITNA